MEETNVLAESPTPYGIWATSCCERHSGERCASTLAARFSRQAVGAWSNTLGTRHQIYAFDSLPVPEVAQAAVGCCRVPRSTARFCMLFWLIEPARSHHLYTCTDNLALDTDNLALDGRDLKS